MGNQEESSTQVIPPSPPVSLKDPDGRSTSVIPTSPFETPVESEEIPISTKATSVAPDGTSTSEIPISPTVTPVESNETSPSTPHIPTSPTETPISKKVTSVDPDVTSAPDVPTSTIVSPILLLLSKTLIPNLIPRGSSEIKLKLFKNDTTTIFPCLKCPASFHEESIQQAHLENHDSL